MNGINHSPLIINHYLPALQAGQHFLGGVALHLHLVKAEDLHGLLQGGHVSTKQGGGNEMLLLGRNLVDEAGKALELLGGGVHQRSFLGR